MTSRKEELTQVVTEQVIKVQERFIMVMKQAEKNEVDIVNKIQTILTKTPACRA